MIDQLRHVDAIFSTYRPDSIINRLDRGELTIAECPAEVGEVIELDEKPSESPTARSQSASRRRDGRRRLDPSGVVKGWAAQRASEFLAALDDTDFCLSAGGDIVCHTADPNREAWRIGIEHPHDPSTLIAVVPIRSGGIATSGTAHRGAHLIDPRTGENT